MGFGMRVGSLVKRANHYNANYLQQSDLTGLIIEVGACTMRPLKVAWSHNYGTFWTMRENLELISESR
jgi:hypothetical protein